MDKVLQNTSFNNQYADNNGEIAPFSAIDFIPMSHNAVLLEGQITPPYDMDENAVTEKKYGLIFTEGEIIVEKQKEHSGIDDVLPNGVIQPEVFQLLVDEEKERVEAKGYQSFLVEIGLNEANLGFFSDKTKRKLALECLDIAKNYFREIDTLSFTSESRIWILMPKITENTAIETVEKVFFKLQKSLHELLDTDQSLLELNMYSMQQPLPTII